MNTLGEIVRGLDAQEIQSLFMYLAQNFSDDTIHIDDEVHRCVETWRNIWQSSL